MSDTKIWNKKNGVWSSSKEIVTSDDIEPVRYDLDIVLSGVNESLNISYLEKNCIGYKTGKIFIYDIYLRFVNSSPTKDGNWAIARINFPFASLISGPVQCRHFNCFYNNTDIVQGYLKEDNTIWFLNGAGIVSIIFNSTDVSGYYKYSELGISGSFIIAE